MIIPSKLQLLRIFRFHFTDMTSFTVAFCAEKKTNASVREQEADKLTCQSVGPVSRVLI